MFSSTASANRFWMSVEVATVLVACSVAAYYTVQLNGPQFLLFLLAILAIVTLRDFYVDWKIFSPPKDDPNP